MKIENYDVRAYITCIVIIFLLLSSSADAEVISHDIVCLKDEAVMLRAETKGKFFSEGGKMIEFAVDGKSLGKSLSGGDGVAYKEFKTEGTGLHKVSVISGKDKDTGLLLVLKKGSGIVFIDIEALTRMPFSKEPMKGSNKIVKGLSKRFPLVYLQSGLLDAGTLKTWIEKNEFPAAPLISFAGGEIFDKLNEKGLKVKLVIGGRAVIEAASKFKPKAFSFEEVEGAEVVKDWEEIGKSLRLAPR